MCELNGKQKYQMGVVALFSLLNAMKTIVQKRKKTKKGNKNTFRIHREECIELRENHRVERKHEERNTCLKSQRTTEARIFYPSEMHVR